MVWSGGGGDGGGGDGSGLQMLGSWAPRVSCRAGRGGWSLVCPCTLCGKGRGLVACSGVGLDTPNPLLQAGRSLAKLCAPDGLNLVKKTPEDLQSLKGVVWVRLLRACHSYRATVLPH